MLRGRVEGTATLEINGKVNPLAKPLALDLKAKVRDLELPPLSPYAIKYSGYGIERGKMSVDLAYVVKPERRADGEQQDRPQPARFRREGRGLDGEPAGQARGRAARRPARRHRPRPAGQRLDQRPAVLARRRDLEGDHEPGRQGGDARRSTLLASAFGGGGAELSRVEFAPGVGDARRRPRRREPRQGRQGARRAAGADAHRHRREPARQRARRLEEGAAARSSFAPRSAARRSPAAPTRRPRSRSATSRVPGAAEGGLPARRHRQAEERRRPGQGPAAGGDGGAAPRQHRRRRRRHAAARGAPRRRRARLPRDARRSPTERLFLGAPKTASDDVDLDAARRPEAGRHLSEPSACRAAFSAANRTRAATGCRVAV